MAGAHCATFSFLSSAIRTTTTLKPVIFASISYQLPLKPGKRKNYLRPKILKTLIKPSQPTAPILPEEPSQEPVSPIIITEIPIQNDLLIETPILPKEDDQVEEFQVSEVVGVAAEHNNIVSKLSVRSVLKVGVYFVGLFAFQTVCAVWVLGKGKSKLGNNNESSDLRISSSSQGKVLLDGYGKFVSEAGNVGYLDEAEWEKKIEEIKAMAREARKSEEKDVKEGIQDGDSDDEGVIFKEKNVIEKEIGMRLVKLQKKLNSARGKSPSLNRNYLEKSEKLENGMTEKSLDVNGQDKSLMFKKKMKFRNGSAEQISDPKGFQGSVSKRKRRAPVRTDTTKNNGSIGNDGGEPMEKEKKVIFPDEIGENVSKTLQEDQRKAIIQGPNSFNSDKENLEKPALVEETGQERDSVQVVKKSGRTQKQNSQEGRKYGAKNPANGSAKRRGTNHVVSNVKNKQSDAKTDMWWFNLPYVLAILMRRGSDHEGPGGLYTFKFSSVTQDQGYTVAFEDRIDANNFCCLLESFFEDLGDFSADIVPLSTKELREAVESNTQKMIVVKKRQLKLYAGQPLADVEMALRALVQSS